jgi:hypothetical protein
MYLWLYHNAPKKIYCIFSASQSIIALCKFILLLDFCSFSIDYISENLSGLIAVFETNFYVRLCIISLSEVSVTVPNEPVLRIRIRIHRIHVFLGLLDPAPDPSIIKQNSKKNLDFDCFVTSFWHFTFKNDVKVPATSNMQKICFLLASWRSMIKIEESGSICQRLGSATLPSTWRNGLIAPSNK